VTLRARRISATAFALLASAGLLCGCGGASHSDSSTGASGPTSKASPEAIAVARAINLHQADLPTMKPNLFIPEAANKARPIAAKITRCGGAVLLVTEEGGISSQLFLRPVRGQAQPEVIRSAVRLLPSAARASENAAASNSPRVLACFNNVLLHDTGGGPISLSALANPLPGVAGSFGLRMITDHPKGLLGPAFRDYKDILGFASGRAVVAATFTRANQPFPTATKRRVLALLLRRANAHAPS
jgi:hypothetical protein